jgi:chromosome partitioning protein
MLKLSAMAQIICIANQKGGVGKTTTAVNLSAALAVSEKRTLLVDCDPQANATTGVGLDKSQLIKTLYHGMIGDAEAKTIIVDSQIECLKVIPSRVELIGFDVEMMDRNHREMAAANTLLIPLQCEFYALEGLSQLVQTFQRIKSGLNPGLTIGGILLTMFDRRTNLSHQVAEDAENYFKKLVFKTTIPRNVRLGEAPSFGQPILLYDALSAGAQSYFSLAKEIMTANHAGRA